MKRAGGSLSFWSETPDFEIIIAKNKGGEQERWG